MSEPKDKRTKEHKEWKAQQGLGDTIEAVLEVTGVKAIVNLFTDDCGCKERKEKLNKAFPYRRKAQRCLTQQQYEQYKLYTKTRTLDVWNESEIHFVIKLYAWVFAIQYNANDLCRSCAGSGKLLLIMSKDLDKVFISYQKDLQDLKMK